MRVAVVVFGIIYGLAFVHAQEERIVAPQRPKEAASVPRIRVVGRVLDAKTGEPLIGVQMRIGAAGTYTDDRGFFALYTEKPDTLVAFLLGYRTIKLPINGATENLLLRLQEIETELEEVSILEEASRESEAGLFLERLRSLEIGELYSQELVMKRSTDFYVPNVLRRLPGVSILGGRYITIRGMGERYNAFAFWAAYPAWLSYDASFGELEQLITTLLGKIEVRKFWTPELLGHFGGGMVDFQLPAATDDGLQISYTAEVDGNAIFRRFPKFRTPLRSPLSPDFPTPSEVIASENNGRPTAQNFLYAQRLRRYTVPDSMAWALPGSLLTILYDRRWERWRISLRGAFSQRYLYNQMMFDDGEFVQEDGEWRFASYYASHSKNPAQFFTQGGGFSWHIGFQPTPEHTFSLEGFGLMNTTQRNAYETGAYINPDIDSFRPISAYYYNFYLPRSYIGIMRPSWHYAPGDGWKIGIQTGYILQGQDIPQSGAMNYVQYPGNNFISYEHELYGESEVYAQILTSRTRADQFYVHPYVEKRWGVGGGWVQLRMGGWYSQESQSSWGRLLGFMADTSGGGPHRLPPSVYLLENIQNVYAPENIRPGGWYLIERTGDYHRHRGETQIMAGYQWLRAGIGEKWEVMLGARYEYWQRRLWNIPIATERETTLAILQDAHFLPALLGKYWLGERQTIRLGANLTLVRPPLPTQIPMPYFDYLWAYYWVGDPTLGTGRSYNTDLRYEWLKDKDKLLAFGLFYKHLRNLPEVYLVPAAFTLNFTYSTRQRRWGDIAGIELELRRVWWSNETNRIWSYFTFTLSESALEKPVWSKIGRLDGRLQGHSPIVSNAGLFFSRKLSEVAFFFNYTSSQIWAMGNDPYQYPHLVEHGRLIGEAQISQRIGDHWEVRLAIWDFINQPYRRTQRVGNSNTFNPDRDNLAMWERWAYRAYLTIRYKL
ncbi:MAG: carboxypeptidase-like regulatory domain-containing protein [Bacteroidia bacterium]|nr:carboxypeptidase-like regulatory domain-containing protein [Bacteroidia bacterium]MDW8236270.1 carboxypeptidase-like regulatory domain-containing protein [Bacteroidia bacterium]